MQIGRKKCGGERRWRLMLNRPIFARAVRKLERRNVGDRSIARLQRSSSIHPRTPKLRGWRPRAADVTTAAALGCWQFRASLQQRRRRLIARPTGHLPIAGGRRCDVDIRFERAKMPLNVEAEKKRATVDRFGDSRRASMSEAAHSKTPKRALDRRTQSSRLLNRSHFLGRARARGRSRPTTIVGCGD